ncbi:MAG: ribosome maturation factor RimM [Actinomycetes bacterium]
MELVVARIGRPHGVRGEVSVELRTDVPERRFVPGVRLTTEPSSAGPLTVHAVRDHNGRLLVSFDEVRDRTTAEGLRDVLLLAEVGDDEEPEAWHLHELVGLRAEAADGSLLGTVVGLEHGPAQDLLVVREPSGHEALVPFVTAIVPTVDVPGGRVVLDPPAGLLEDARLAEDEA